VSNVFTKLGALWAVKGHHGVLDDVFVTLTVGSHRFAPGQKPTGWRMRTTWMRPGSSWWISRILPTELCWR